MNAGVGPAARTRAFRGTVFHFVGEAQSGPAERVAELHTDGLLVVRDGRIAQVGDAAKLLPSLPPGAEVVDYSGKWLVPGFIDTHVHYAQSDIIASPGEQLLTWLERYTFPAEGRFADAEHAREAADFFLAELLRNGTTTASVFPTVHKSSVDALFAAAKEQRMCIISGKLLMDRNCPEFLRDTAESGYHDSQELIERWHGRDRLHYAVTPRFAPTSSDAQLELAGKLVDEHPGVYVQSHVAENRDEVRWVAELFPWARSYLDVYDRFGLLRPNSVYAHCIHLDEQDRQRIAARDAVMSFCPTSNLFLGSGLFDYEAARRARAHVALGTDVAGGTSFSMLRTMHEAYKVMQLEGQLLSSFDAFYLATRGAAQALGLADRLGSFAPGNDADFVVLDPQATALLARRFARTETLAEQLFAFMMLGDDRAVAATYILGEAAHVRDGVTSSRARRQYA